MKTGEDKYRSIIEQLADAFASHRIAISGNNGNSGDEIIKWQFNCRT